jgi:hypothetical protein
MTRGSRIVSAMLGGGLVAGTCDFLYANLFYYLWRDLPPKVLWQSVASGALGGDAFDGGYGFAALGVGFHFLIAVLMAVVFVLLSLRVRLLLRRPFIVGPLYGVFLYYFMNGVVLPLSSVPTPPDMSGFPMVGTSVMNFVGGLLIHAFGVGLPIVLFANRRLSVPCVAGRTDTPPD